MIQAVDRFIHTDLRDIDWNKGVLYSLVVTRIMNPLDLPKKN